MRLCTVEERRQGTGTTSVAQSTSGRGLCVYRELFEPTGWARVAGARTRGKRGPP